LRIIDYSLGFVGSTPDASAWIDTRLAKDPSQLLEPAEWCWADSGYPIEPWLITPYTMPASAENDNKMFNYYFSRIRVGSEHAIGYLKGRFQSLNELRISVRSKNDMDILAIWVHVCITLHAFAMDFEEIDIISDEFLFLENNVQDGHNSKCNLDQEEEYLYNNEGGQQPKCSRNTTRSHTRLGRGERDVRMKKGREVRERLKSCLLSSLIPLE
jgi:hypothetical protein